MVALRLQALHFLPGCPARARLSTLFPKVCCSVSHAAAHGEPLPDQMHDLVALTTKPTRPYSSQYAGLRREIARNNGWHPIRDKALIQKRLDLVLLSAKHIKKQNPKIRYRC